MASIFDNSIVNTQNVTSGGAPQQQRPPQGPSSSGSFNNISNYLKANQGANLANKLVSQSQKQAQQVQGDVNKASQDFKANSEKAIGGITTAGDAARGAIEGTSTGTVGDTTKAAEDYGTATQGAGGYKGPTSIANQSGLQSGVENINNMAKNTNTEGGRFALLRQLMGRQGYNAGQQKLDQLVLQGDQKQLSGLNTIKRTANETAKQFQDATGQVANTVQANLQTAQQVAEQTKQTADKAFGKLNADVENAVKSKRELAAQTQQSIQNDIDLLNTPYYGFDSQQRLIREQARNRMLQRVGMNSSADMWGLTPDKFISTLDPEMINKYNTANQQQFNQAKMLSGIVGDQTKNIFGAEEGPKTLDPFVKVDKDAMNAQIATQKTNYGNETKSLNQSLDAEKSKYTSSKGALDFVSKATKDRFGRSTASTQDVLNYIKTQPNNDMLMAAYARAKALSTGSTNVSFGDAFSRLMANNVNDVQNEMKSGGSIANSVDALNAINSKYGQGAYKFTV
jgi:hypothetical protein